MIYMQTDVGDRKETSQIVSIENDKDSAQYSFQSHERGYLVDKNCFPKMGYDCHSKLLAQFFSPISVLAFVVNKDGIITHYEKVDYK